MGFLDKAKEAAAQATAKAQQGMAQGQSKLDGMQAKRDLDGLYRSLGEGYYLQQRSGGDAGAVTAGLAAIDQWHVDHPEAAAAATAGPGAAPTTSAPAPEAPTGNFTLDDD